MPRCAKKVLIRLIAVARLQIHASSSREALSLFTYIQVGWHNFSDGA